MGKNKEEAMSKKLILFTNDESLSALFADFFSNHPFEVHLVTTPLDNIDFTNSVSVLDYDTDSKNMSELLSNLVKKSGSSNKVIVASEDCERRNVTDTAKRGADRFVVKPINKTRIKKYILPYMEYATAQTTETSTAS